MLPYNVGFSSMVTTTDNKIILVGGGGDLNAMLELDDVSSKWREIKLPVKKLREYHLAFQANMKHTNMFCGK